MTTHQFPNLVRGQSLPGPMPDMKNLHGTRRERSLPNRIVHLVFPVALSVKQESDFLSNLLGFIRDEAAVGHVFERSNRRDNAVEPLLRLLETPVLHDVARDFVKVVESSRGNLNVKSHDVSEAAARPA